MKTNKLFSVLNSFTMCIFWMLVIFDVIKIDIVGNFILLIAVGFNVLRVFSE